MEPIEKFFVGLIIGILVTGIVMDGRVIHRKVEERKSDSYLVSRIVECENQISLLRERIERLEESK